MVDMSSIRRSMSVPMNYLISNELDVVYARWSGNVALDQFRAMFEMYLNDENYVLGRPDLCDFSGLEALDADFNQIWSALNMVNAVEGKEKDKTHTVIYAPSEIAYGSARMYQSLAEYEGGVKVTVCRTEAETLAVLNLDFPSIDDLLDRGHFLLPNPREAKVPQSTLDCC